MKPSRILFVAAIPVVLALSGCETTQKVISSVKSTVSGSDQTQSSSASRGAADLQTGVRLYEDGQYAEAQTRLQNALSAGLWAPEAVRAHKYLAFIHCASKREAQCRMEFRKALAIDPSFQLSPAESGHPIWGRIFREVKQQRG